MKTAEIRRLFIEFFQLHGHTALPAAPMVNKNDPSLFFINAGMNPFKAIFLGNQVSPHPRVVNSQPCLRVSGKHNDLEEVGLDTYHHTFFEMLGSWSFGDYGKREAITWAYTLLTKVYNIPKERIYASVFEGDAVLGLAPDKESYALWQQMLPAEQIVYSTKENNFWEMAATGPCGPCSEIHIDLRTAKERATLPGHKLVNQGHPQVVEIWNLVFIEYNRKEDQSLSPLPAKHVDTGMGLERLAMVLQHKQSTYDTDIFAPLLQWIGKRTGIHYGSSADTDIAMRVIVDHIRAISFVIADGQLPSNQKGGYIIRRLLRRAVRYGYSKLGLDKPFLYELVGVLVKSFAGVYPNLAQQADFVAKTIQQEEVAFFRTLAQGLHRLEALLAAHKKQKAQVLSGAAAFELYDTYGFPIDLTALLAREQGYTVDLPGFELAMHQQKARSREAAEEVTGDWQVLRPGVNTVFVGYERLATEAHITQYRMVTTKEGSSYQIVLDTTPFYPQGGGQVGDTGTLAYEGGVIQVLDTQWDSELIVHRTATLPPDPTVRLYAAVDKKKRHNTARNHTATHLLQAVLREVLGKHIEQKGSLVHAAGLRFDFSHSEKLSPAVIHQVEARVNELICANYLVEDKRHVPMEEAKKMGAMALFGEKYGETVRMIRIDRYSLELCGGTHVQATGNIGYCKIVSETSVAAGVRRLEALTGEGFGEWLVQQEEKLAKISALLPAGGDVVQGVAQLVKQTADLKKLRSKLTELALAQAEQGLTKKFNKLPNYYLLVHQVEAPDTHFLKTLTLTLSKGRQPSIIVLTAQVDGQPYLAISVSPDLTGQHSAHELVQRLAPYIGGKGGGQATFAMAGGTGEGIPQLLEAAVKLMTSYE